MINYRSILFAGLAAGVISQICLFRCAQPPVEPQPPRPLPVSVTGDSLVKIYETLTVRVSVPEAVSGFLWYVWFIDNPVRADTSLDSVIRVTFSVSDSGQHFFAVKATDGNGRESPLDTLYFTVTFSRPSVTLLAAPVASAGVSYTIRFRGSDEDNRISSFRWYIDDSLKSMSTPDSVVSWVWKVADTGVHAIVAQAIDKDGIRSRPYMSGVTVALRRPVLRALPDTGVKVNDTLVLRLSASSPDSVPLSFRYAVDDPKAVVVTDDTLARFRWEAADSGLHTIIVDAVGDNGIASVPDTAMIMVTYRRPTAKLLLPDTIAYLNDTVRLAVEALDADGAIDHYYWSIGGPSAAWFITKTGKLAWVFGGKAGVSYGIRAVAVDNDGFASDTASALIRVLPGMPSVTAPRDTAVSSLDSVRIVCRASDPNGSIVKYLWDYSGETWDDSSTSSAFTLRYGGKGVVRLVIGARDDDGLMATDTVMVTFNRPPDSIVLRSPGPRDTLRFHQTAPRCSVSFAFNCADPDNDSVTFTLFWGPSADSMKVVYEGKNTAATAGAADPGLYHWRLVARDAWGHSRSVNGAVTFIREYRICFVGHSIVAGWGGDNTAGGFRRGVLDSLRKITGAYDRLKAAGPLTTPHMISSPVDDSCLALSATTAREIMLLFTYGHPKLVADIWVLMLGANDGYSYKERQNALIIVDGMIARNPSARIYVLNGIPYPTQTTYDSLTLRDFNAFLADSAADRTKKGAHVFIVDAFSRMSKNGQFDPTWFTDIVHPNQTGYNRLRDLIVSTMKSSVPPAIPGGQ